MGRPPPVRRSASSPRPSPASASPGASGPRRRGARRKPVREKLAEVAEQGGLTLVLGAGISLSHGVPGWTALVKQLWEELHPHAPLVDESPLAQMPAVALERIARELGPEAFIESLRSHLYAHVTRPTRQALLRRKDTLSVVASALVKEHARGSRRRIQRVITFNADDLLEQATRALAPRRVALKAVARASHHPERGTGEQPLPCYHLHGYLPAPGSAPWHAASPDALVFTEAQYWRAVATPLSFANRVMAFALHDTRCVFVGLSMTDLNVLRWLADRADELESDKRAQFMNGGGAGDDARTRRAVRQALERHFWIHTGSDDPGGHLAAHLETRGVLSILLEGGWGSGDFAALWDEVLPEDAPERTR